MKKELNYAMETLDSLNVELENIKNILLQEKYLSNDALNSNNNFEIEFKNLKEENDFLKQQLIEHREFLNKILENIEDVFVSIKELRDNE